MVDKLQVQDISPDASLQRELVQVGNGDATIEKKEVDSNGDGYLDCRYYKNSQQFRRLQSEFFKVGLIHRLSQGLACNIPSPSLQFDYLHLEMVGGRLRMFAYFSNESDAQLFKEQNKDLSGAKMVIVDASKVERTNSMIRDNIDPKWFIPDHFASQIDDVNRPEEGTSKSGKYYGFDVTGAYSFPDSALLKLNSEGKDNANCFNAALVFTNILKTDRFVSQDELFSVVNNPIYFRQVSDEKVGDLVVWYKMNGDKKMAVHAFIDLGYGWILTKNGNGNAQPYRVQRRNYAHYFYEQDINNSASKEITESKKYSYEIEAGPSLTALSEIRYRANKTRGVQ